MRFVKQTGLDNPLFDTAYGVLSVPALGDLDGDGGFSFQPDAVDGPNTRPVAVNDKFNMKADRVLFGNVLDANPDKADSDADNDVLSVRSNALGIDRPLGNGRLTFSPDGKFSFNPNGGYDDLPAGETRTETFFYILQDGRGGADTAIVTIYISAGNEAPTTSPVTLEPFAEDTQFLVTQDMLLANAVDADGDTLTVSGVALTAGSKGELFDNGNGTWTYTPAPDDDTEVTFEYTISDGTDNVAGIAQADIVPVNDAPVAQDDSAETARNTAVNIPVLANDSDIDGGPLRVVSVGPAGNGTVTIRADEVSVRYTPSAGFSGFDTFSYTVSDGTDSPMPSGATGNPSSTDWATVRVLVASHSGSSGNDVLLTTQQADYILAGDGADRILAYGGADYIDGGRGADTISGGAGADTLIGGDGADTFLTTAAELAGDEIDGGNQVDTLQLTDPIAVMPANFTLVNVEQLSFPGSLQVGHTAPLDLSALTLTGAGNQINGGTADSFIIGTRSNDRITDSAGNDVLRGADGNDTIQAGVGQDFISGGRGNDTLMGATASTRDFTPDTFMFDTPLNAATNVDTILGFEAGGLDLIGLSDTIFASVTGGMTQSLDASEFRASAGGLAADSDDYILFDTTTGNLFYDADGSGAGPRVLFAMLGTGYTGTVDVADFVVLSPAPV